MMQCRKEYALLHVKIRDLNAFISCGINVPRGKNDSYIRTFIHHHGIFFFVTQKESSAFLYSRVFGWWFA